MHKKFLQSKNIHTLFGVIHQPCHATSFKRLGNLRSTYAKLFRNLAVQQISPLVSNLFE